MEPKKISSDGELLKLFLNDVKKIFEIYNNFKLDINN